MEEKYLGLKHMATGAQRSKEFTNGLISELAEGVIRTLTEFDNIKADKPTRFNVTIPQKGWSNGENKTFYYEIPAEDITEKNTVFMAFDDESIYVAQSCGLYSVKTLDGAIRVYATSEPSAAMSAECLIVN